VIRTGDVEVVEFDGPLLELVDEVRLCRDPRLAALGQDVLGEELDSALFLRRLRARDPRRPIGDALLDQGVVAGIGNVWKAEACFAVGVDPWRALAAVRDEEALALLAFAREHMRVSAREGVGARPAAAVYGRAGMPCVRCGVRIESRGQWENNRLTFWCPGCQV
jgi:endonuclease-8